MDDLTRRRAVAAWRAWYQHPPQRHQPTPDTRALDAWAAALAAPPEQALETLIVGLWGERRWAEIKAAPTLPFYERALTRAIAAAARVS